MWIGTSVFSIDEDICPKNSFGALNKLSPDCSSCGAFLMRVEILFGESVNSKNKSKLFRILK